MTRKDHIEYAIIGGGISGLTLAIALHHRGIKFTIYEQASHFGEIGAGVSFSPNALQAMKICHSGIYDSFERVCTRNLWPSKQKVWFDYFNGYREVDDPREDTPAFTISNELGQNGVHRARFLDEIIHLIPQGAAQFRKRLDTISQGKDGKYLLTFVDGSQATADGVIGCDGIKSRVRQLMFGVDNPCSHPSYTYKYAYRALVPMDIAVEKIGKAQAENSCMHLGPGGHILTFPVNHGQLVNVVAFHTTKDDWPDDRKLTAPSKREHALRDFSDFGKTIKALLELAKPDLDVWAIFDLAKNPLPTYVDGGICLAGDAAHATSPHHGAGAGMCIEDSAVLAELLTDDNVRTAKDIESAFKAYDLARRQRTQWLVQSSRFTGDCYEWRAEGVGDDMTKIEAEINRRNGQIANVDVMGMCTDAKKQLDSLLAK